MRRAIMPRSWSRSDSASAWPWWRTLRKPRLLHQLGDAVARVEPFGIELVGDHAHLVVHDHFARDQALAVLADGALAAHEVVLVDPLPRALVEVLVHVARRR